ncbi:hypothetical protein [Lacticaseibacillus nasuensis]|uniref:Uncharacterized protein n=1 Tax=Lacticaseibacillus nasuensis JCM 17158 TaxID=1291734 RepID=A0A0R1K4S6_9LACO|nr:hypothetical protein [Lacticaseibacillus nasuensis]KRK74279.1 hypothetical protein FD02_GL000879 [Lacticaseibacillus nasuensis JCM 17158]
MIYGLLSIDGIGMIITLYGFFGCREAFFHHRKPPRRPLRLMWLGLAVMWGAIILSEVVLKLTS